MTTLSSILAWKNLMNSMNSQKYMTQEDEPPKSEGVQYSTGEEQKSESEMDCPWNSLGQDTGVGSFSLLQGVFPTQGLNPGLPHYGQILYQLSHKGSPRILERVAYLFSSRSSQHRNRTVVSCTAGRFFTN